MSGLGPARRRFGWLRRAVRPIREAAASFALVNEERNKRVAQMDAWLGGGQTLEYGSTLMERIDLVVQELWRRAEGADARNATEIQRLAEFVTVVQRENAALLRRLEPPSRDSLTYVPHAQTDPDGAADGEGAAHKVTMRMLFDEVERGSREEVLSKLSKFAGYFLNHAPVVDLGCGQGEFLEVLKAAGIRASGVDLVAESVEVCRVRGLEAEQGDLFEHLARLEPATIGGFFSSQVVEHLPPERLPEMLAGIERALKADGVAVIETPNPATFATHVQSFWRDPTHTRPVPAPSLSFAARSAGLAVENVVYGSPSPQNDRLKFVPDSALAGADDTEKALASAFNDAIGQLNELLYGYQDYALVLRKQPADLRDADTRVGEVALPAPDPVPGASITNPTA